MSSSSSSSEAVPLNEKRVPCGLCQTPVLESHFRAGAAKMVQGVLYCVNCSKKAEEARLETVAFKQSLAAGTFYQCAKCSAPVPIADIRSGSVVYYLGELSCRACARDLRAILGPREPNAPSSQRMLRSPSGMGLVAESPPGACALCRGPVSKRAVQEGRALVHEGQTYCQTCRKEIEEILDLSRLSCERLLAFTCSACQAAIPPDDVLDDKALRYRGQLFCRGCAKDMGFSRSSGEIKIEPPKRTVMMELSTLPVAVPCARCERSIPPVDVRTGKTVEVAGKLYCRRCKEALEEAKEKIEHRAAKSLVCAHCGRTVTSKEVADKKVVYAEGNLLCGRCAKDPGVLLRGHASGEVEVGENLCVTCGAPADASGQCQKCAAQIQDLMESSARLTGELEGLLEAVPCEGAGCGKGVTIDDLENGRAEIVGNKTLCSECAAKAKAKRPKRIGALCARCEAPLSDEDSHAPGALCERCLASSQADQDETEAALSLSSEVPLKCSTCGKMVGPDELKAGAKSIDGKLLCRACKTRVRAAPPRPSAATKPCTTCDAPMKGPPLVYGGRAFCMACKVELDRILAEGANVPEGAACTACKKPAQGGLAVAEKVFCGSCKKAADYYVLYTVRERRAAPRRRPIPKKGLALVFAAGAAAFAAYLFLSSAGPEAPTAKALPASKTSAAEDALQQALRMTQAPPATLDRAREVVAEVEKLGPAVRGEGEKGDLATRFDAALAKARKRRDDFGPPLAAQLVEKASSAYKKTGRPEDAKIVLEAFPKDLEESPAGRTIFVERERWSALADCTRKAQSLLASSDAATWEGLQHLLGSPEAQKCEFAKTDLGKECERERRRRKNQYDAHGPTPGGAAPPAAQDPLIVAYGFEQKYELARADAAYRDVLARDADSAEALLGLARVELERERIDALRPVAERALVLGKNLPEAGVISAWLQHLEGIDGRARITLGNVPEGKRGRLGRRLLAIVSSKDMALVYEEKRVRIYASSAVPRGVVDHLRVLVPREAALASVALALGGTEQLDVFLTPDESARSTLVGRLEARQGQNGHVPGSFGVVLAASADDASVLRAIGSAFVARADIAPPWLVASFADELSRPAGASGAGRTQLQQLEKMTAQSAAADEEALSSARGFAALVHQLEGAQALAAYCQAYQLARRGGEDSKKAADARKILEAAVVKVLRR